MKKINMARYAEKVDGGKREYLRLHEDRSFALRGDGVWYEKVIIWATRWDEPDKITLVPAAPEMAEKLEAAFQRELAAEAEEFAKFAAPIAQCLANLEKDRGPILYGPSPELLEEMGGMPTDPGWQTEAGMGHLGKD